MIFAAKIQIICDPSRANGHDRHERNRAAPLEAISEADMPEAVAVLHKGPVCDAAREVRDRGRR